MVPDVEAVRWRPFRQTLPCLRRERDRQTYMRENSAPAEKIDDIHKQLTQLGEENGIVFDFDAIARAPNTLDAHRVIHWSSLGLPDTQDRMVGMLFSLYFEQGQDIGDHEVLVDAAASVGMDAEVVAGSCKVRQTRQRFVRRSIPPAASACAAYHASSSIRNMPSWALRRQMSLPTLFARRLKALSRGFLKIAKRREAAG